MGSLVTAGTGSGTSRGTEIDHPSFPTGVPGPRVTALGTPVKKGKSRVATLPVPVDVAATAHANDLTCETSSTHETTPVLVTPTGTNDKAHDCPGRSPKTKNSEVESTKKAKGSATPRSKLALSLPTVPGEVSPYPLEKEPKDNRSDTVMAPDRVVEKARTRRKKVDTRRGKEPNLIHKRPPGATVLAEKSGETEEMDTSVHPGVKRIPTLRSMVESNN